MQSHITKILERKLQLNFLQSRKKSERTISQLYCYVLYHFPTTLITALEARPKEEFTPTFIETKLKRDQKIQIPSKISREHSKRIKDFTKQATKRKKNIVHTIVWKTIPPENVGIPKTNQTMFRIVKTFNKTTRNIFPPPQFSKETKTILKMRKKQIQKKASLTLNKKVSQRIQKKRKHARL